MVVPNMSELDTIYKALRLVPDFDGNPNVLTRFIQLCDQLAGQFSSPETSDLSKCALLNGILNKVIGPAARLINSNGIPNNWPGIRSALIHNFADHRDETALYNDLAILTQGSGSPQEFYERCQNIFSTIMTYISLHDTIQTTVDAKRDLYKKLTLQAFLRGLGDPLGSRIRCMRPETIEKALEFVQEETNTIYLQNRNQRLPDRKPSNYSGPMTLPNFASGFKMPYQPFSMPAPRPITYGMPGPSRPYFTQQSAPQWKPNYFQPRQFGPTRTQQIFRALPNNYNPQHNNFQIPPRPQQAPQQAFPRPMSGVSHFVSKPLPPTNTLTGHDWSKFGNPPPTNYFKTREVNLNDCYSDSDYYVDNYDTNCDYYDYSEYYLPYGYDPSIQECTDYQPITQTVTNDVTDANVTDQDFQKVAKSDKLK